MDKVYIVEGHVSYNQSTILSVHLDEESAKRKVKEVERHSIYDWVDVVEHRVEF